MIALIGTVRRLHLPEKRIHFCQGHYPVGADRVMAGHRREHVVAGIRDSIAAARFLQIG